MTMRWMSGFGAALVLAMAACGDGGENAARPPGAQPEPAESAAADGSAVTERPAAPADSAAAGLAVVLERRGARTYAIQGRTDARALELSVEDGHNILYGPAEIDVQGGTFRTEITLEPTDRPTVFAYVTSRDGARQWVIPIPLDLERVEWGAGAAELPAVVPGS